MRTDAQSNGHDEANSRFSQFCESAYKLIPALTALSRTGRLSLTVKITDRIYFIYLFVYLFIYLLIYV